MKEFWNMVKNEDTLEEELKIDGDIQMEQSFWDWLLDKPDRSASRLEKTIKAVKGKNLVVWINSNGGSCAAASVIYSALMEHKKSGGTITAKVNTAISAASVIAMAADQILVAPTGIMMIHNPWTAAEGEVKDMQKAIEILTQVKESIINAYQLKTGKSRDEISRLMDEETWMSAEKAISLGFADGMLYEEEVDEQIQDGILKGAKAVYNSISKEVFEEKLKEILKEDESQPKDKADFFILKSKLELEKARF
jgi:ATP-dependent Clp protease protease subunit